MYFQDLRNVVVFIFKAEGRFLVDFYGYTGAQALCKWPKNRVLFLQKSGIGSDLAASRNRESQSYDFFDSNFDSDFWLFKRNHRDSWLWLLTLRDFFRDFLTFDSKSRDFLDHNYIQFWSIKIDVCVEILLKNRFKCIKIYQIAKHHRFTVKEYDLLLIFVKLRDFMTLNS